MIEDTPENDAEHEAWWAMDEKWRKKHPAGKDNATADCFPVTEIPLSINQGGGKVENNDSRWAW